MKDYAELEKRLRERARYVRAFPTATVHHEGVPALLEEAAAAIRLANDVRAEDEAAMRAGDFVYRQQQIADWMSQGEEPPEADVPSNACYRGNSVSWIYSKAENYKKALGRVWDALREAGIESDGKTHCADAVRHALLSRADGEKT